VPLTVIVAQDLRFFDKLPELFPHRPDAAELFASNVALAEETAFRNATLQGSYLRLALRALELDVGSLSGFDRAGVYAELFPDRRVRCNWLMNVDTGDPSKLFPRGPRLDSMTQYRCRDQYALADGRRIPKHDEPDSSTTISSKVRDMQALTICRGPHPSDLECAMFGNKRFARSTAPADRVYHFVDLRFFTVDGGTGADKRPFHGAVADD
jgi:hypothetical protein